MTSHPSSKPDSICQKPFQVVSGGKDPPWPQGEPASGKLPGTLTGLPLVPWHPLFPSEALRKCCGPRRVAFRTEDPRPNGPTSCGGSPGPAAGSWQRGRAPSACRTRTLPGPSAAPPALPPRLHRPRHSRAPRLLGPAPRRPRPVGSPAAAVTVHSRPRAGGGGGRSHASFGVRIIPAKFANLDFFCHLVFFFTSNRCIF